MAGPSSEVTLFLCGDVMTGRGIDQVLPHSVDPKIYESYVKDARDYVLLAEQQNGPIPKPVSYSYIWGDALQVWNKIKPHLKIINLETSITTNPAPWPGKEVQYRMHPKNINVLTAAGIDCCSLANNHTLDWNRPGLLETMQTLQQAGIAFAGAGKNLAEAGKPALLKAGESRVIFLAYGSETSGIPAGWVATPQQSGVNLLPDLSPETVKQIGRQVKQVKQPGDIVVFSVHWSSNWGYDIPPMQRSFAHKLIDEAGVDLIHGHSSHHPRAIEVYKDKLILYGAGDFITDYEGISGHDQFRGDLCLMYFPKIDAATGKLLNMQIVPMRNQNFRLNHVTVQESKWLYEVLKREGKKFGTGVKALEDNSFVLKW